MRTQCPHIDIIGILQVARNSAYRRSMIIKAILSILIHQPPVNEGRLVWLHLRFGHTDYNLIRYLYRYVSFLKDFPFFDWANITNKF
jgi:hypothetical protein